ncbi:MAG: ATPase, T2SS/T4P/T4SS family [Rhabdochlamydiaceae bacterium]|nr:ATPase, T2SS/T4P/T4SS family [Candidatus Amphrikana amoebophyrae]
MAGLLKSLAQGGQILAHRVRMVRQVLKMALIISLSISIIFFALELLKIPVKQYQGTWYYYKVLYFDKESQSTIKESYWNPMVRTKKSRIVLVPRNSLLKKALRDKYALFTSVGKVVNKADSLIKLIFLTLSLFFTLQGILAMRRKQVSGIYFKSLRWLKLRLLLSRQLSNISIGKMPLIKGSETKHMLITGTTGTGKSTCLNQLLQSIRKQGDRAIIVDVTGEFVSNFYREGQDFILNPFDNRSVEWHPWCEGGEDYHFEQIAKNLIPNNTQYDQFFPEASRAVLSAALKKAYVTKQFNIEDFTDFLLRADVEELYEELRDTDAALYLDPKGERTTLSIRATVSNIIRYFRALKPTETPFSIKEWILSEAEKSEWLFISSSTEQRASLNPLIAMWFSIAMNALKSREPSRFQQKLWFIIDELPTLEKLEPLESALAEFRKYEGCIVIAVQDLSQLDKRYGTHVTKTIIDLCGTKICLRQGDAEVAKRVSSYFGQKEMLETQESLSYGAHEMRDGVSLSKSEKEKAVVSSSQIMSLKDLEAYVKYPSNLPITKVHFSH